MITKFNRRLLAPVLYPLSLLYRFVTGIRNKLFDWNILKSEEFDFPIISVGNITVGGTGKTPHVEYLIDLLSKEFKTAFLSRGYKRKTRGFVFADSGTSPEQIGDEPFQIFNKYKDIFIAVDEKRVNGVQQLKARIPDLSVVILDDAFQHRYISPGVSIVLIDYNRPVFNDHLLPYGELREYGHGLQRANIVIVTKVPRQLKPIEKRLWIKELDLFPYQFLFFTSFDYGNLESVFFKEQKRFSLESLKDEKTGAVIVSGIANPEPLVKKVSQYCSSVEKLIFPDHYNYSDTVIEKLRQKFTLLREEKKIIITTEKDAVKLGLLSQMDKNLKENLYSLPVKMKFLDDKGKEFDNTIIKYVKKNKRINRLHK